jgi:hypothetical protein
VRHTLHFIHPFARSVMIECAVLCFRVVDIGQRYPVLQMVVIRIRMSPLFVAYIMMYVS